MTGSGEHDHIAWPGAFRIITAPWAVGLGMREGGERGTWRAPRALMDAGLDEKLRPETIVHLPRPPYLPGFQEGTRILNGKTIREYGLRLVAEVAAAHAHGQFPLVIGGDCSVLMPALAGARQTGPLALVHLDGHSDFRNPSNHDFSATPGAAAGMDLALATGRGEALLACWPGAAAPLVPDELAIQIGEREELDPDWAWPDVCESGIARVTAREFIAEGVEAAARRAIGVIRRAPEARYWIHLDIDVLDQRFMSAVDCPGSPGLDPERLRLLFEALVNEAAPIGMTVTIYDPELDPGGACALVIVELLEALFQDRQFDPRS